MLSTPCDYLKNEAISARMNKTLIPDDRRWLKGSSRSWHATKYRKHTTSVNGYDGQWSIHDCLNLPLMVIPTTLECHFKVIWMKLQLVCKRLCRELSHLTIITFTYNRLEDLLIFDDTNMMTYTRSIENIWIISINAEHKKQPTQVFIFDR